MIYFPAIVSCGHAGCTKTAKIRFVFLGESGNYNAWEIHKRPKDWCIATNRFGPDGNRCPKHNAGLNSTAPNAKGAGGLSRSKQKPSRHNNNGAYESNLPPLTTGGVRISDDTTYGPEGQVVSGIWGNVKPNKR